MSSVTFSKVTKRFAGDVTAVDGLDLDVGDGELLVVVGPSGCGKTTTLRMLAGLEDVTEGEIRIGDRRVNDVSAKSRDIAMVFQSYALYPHLTVGENLAYPLRIAKVPKAERNARVLQVAHQLQLSELLDRQPRHLSGGQRQRVAMGRAIVRQPQVFLMDEPLSNLDAKLRVVMRSEVAELQRSLGTTMFYVTHDQVEAMTMGHRVALMSGGVLQQVAPPEELYRRPDNVFVAGFIGSPPMNLIRGDIVATPDGSIAIASGGALVGLDTDGDNALDVGRASTIVGVRAEHLVLGPLGEGVAATVRVVEMLGSEHLIHLEIAGIDLFTHEVPNEYGSATHRVLAKVHDDRRTFEVGDVVGVRMNARHLHLFDQASGRRLEPAHA
jgi:multiple sugar transport system ATP-binding protein